MTSVFLCIQEEIAKDLLSGDYEEETQSSADDLTPSVTSHEATDFFPRTLRCKLTSIRSSKWDFQNKSLSGMIQLSLQ